MKSILSFSILFTIVFSLKTEYIKYEEEDKIAIITINRPKELNALNIQVLEELNKTLDTIDTDKIRALIITGDGEKAFVAGGDIEEVYLFTQKEAEEFSKKGNNFFRKIETFPIPTIAAVNGYALGIGCELTLSCDIRICSDNAVFSQPETGLGIIPGLGGTQRLSRLIGMGKSKQMIFTGKNFRSDEAFRFGLVNAIYPQEELLAEAKKLAKTIAKNSPIAVKNSKKAINEGMQVDIDSAIKIEEKNFGECFETSEQVERMNNFLNKSKKKNLKES
jgi:enoyl-CoA hydratase